MTVKYVRELENGKKLDVFIAVEDDGNRFNVYMSKVALWMFENTPDKEITGDIAKALTDFLEDDEKREEFENGMTYAIAIKKGADPLGTDLS